MTAEVESCDLSRDYYDILSKIEKHHTLFYFLCEQAHFVSDESIGTAGVSFNGKGNPVDIRISPSWWNSLSDYDKLFVICHECLHIALNHGLRGARMKERNIANQAMDISINHMLVSNFGFDREELSIDGCWIDTAFQDQKVEHNQCFEYYFNRLKKESSDKEEKGNGEGGSGENKGGNGRDGSNEGFDNHDGLYGELSKESASSVMEVVGESLTNEQKSSLNEIFSEEKGSQQSGTGFGSWLSLSKVESKKSRKWESIIKDWSKAQLRFHESEEDQWAHINRRMFNLPKDFILPSTNVVEAHEIDKILVYFFMDSSGSCLDHMERFFKACKSLPEDKFIVRPYSFDTRVENVDVENNRMYGGGGTFFHIIEDFIQNEIYSAHEDYPAAVFVLTDGYGNDVKPKHPERWYWLLTKGGTKSYIPNKSHSFDLGRFC